MREEARFQATMFEHAAVVGVVLSSIRECACIGARCPSCFSVLEILASGGLSVQNTGTIANWLRARINYHRHL